MKTFYRWPGNKLIHANKIISFFPEKFNTYYEPFLGSGAIFLTLQHPKWVINDLNIDVFNIWDHVQNNYTLLKRHLKLFIRTFKSLEIEDKKIFAQRHIEKLNKDNMSPAKRAAYYIMMKYVSYLGHIFVKNKFKFVGIENNLYKENPPYYMGEKYILNLDKVHEYLNVGTSGRLFNTDYAKVLKLSRKGDFVFLDPPYYEPHVNYQFNYNKNEVVDISFLFELRSELKKLDKKGVKWLMTQSDIPDIHKVFGEYNFEKIKVYRRQKNTYVYELIVKNY